MKLLQSLEDADASPLTCDNMSERALQTLKTRNVLNRDPMSVEYILVGIMVELAGWKKDGSFSMKMLPDWLAWHAFSSTLL